MAAKANAKRLHISLVGKSDITPSPDIALYQLRKGKPVKKVARVEKDTLPIDKSWVKSTSVMALGPDMDELSKVKTDSLLVIRAGDLVMEERFEVAREWWDRWILKKVCVSGRVKKCFPGTSPLEIDRTGISVLGSHVSRFADTGCSGCGTTATTPGPGTVSSLGAGTLSYGKFRPMLCSPVCHGVVEVYEKCCNTAIVVDICDIMPFHPDCLGIRDLCKRYPRLCGDPCLLVPELCGGITEVGPIDPVGPVVRLDMDKIPLDPIEARSVKLARSKVDPVTMAERALPPRVVGDMKALLGMKSSEAREYIMDRPHLYPLFYHCTTKKVGEAILRPDGTFSFCYTSASKGCASTTYAFKVKQWQDGNWVEVYNGLKSHDYYSRDEAKVLYANYKAVACENEPGPDYEKPYVMLQKVGTRDSYHLKSPDQHAPYGIGAPLPANAGLLDMNYATDCPLSGRVSFRLKMSDEIYEDVKAKYYRISYAPCNDNGNATEAFTNLTVPITWRRLVYNVDHFDIEHVRLGPQLPVGGVYGLYEIPDPTNDNWLDSIHGVWDTLSEQGGRYILKVEIFKSSGALIKPETPGSDFVYLHWTGPDTPPTPVTQNSLVHVLRTNHTDCMALIEDLRLNGVSSSEDCQFVTGQAGDGISMGYRAYHEEDPLAGTFMWDFTLKWQRGFNGALTSWDSGTDNRPSTLDAGEPAKSPQLTIANMFAGYGSTSPHKKCTFLAKLYVRAKHTNGSSRLQEYDAADYASFALEMLPGGAP